MSNKAITWAYAQEFGPREGGAKFLLVTLADKADEKHSCWPTKASLAELTSTSVETVEKQLKLLVERGMVCATPTVLPGRGTTANRYYLAVDGVFEVDYPLGIDTPGGLKTPRVVKTGGPGVLNREGPGGFNPPALEEPTLEPSSEPSINPLEGSTLEVVPDAFEVFWGIYPRHEARKVAESRFRKALEHHPAAVIIDGARRYAEFCKAVGRSSEHIAHPSSWLNQERWHDELQLPAQAPMTHRRDQAVQDQIRRFQAIDAAATAEPMREIS